MKYIKISSLICAAILLFVFQSSGSVHRDTINGGVSFQLHLVQKFENGRYQAMAVSVSAINNSQEDIYSPLLKIELLQRISIYTKNSEFKYEQMSRDINNQSTAKNKEVHFRNYLPATNLISNDADKPISTFENDSKLSSHIAQITKPAFSIDITGCVFQGAFLKKGASIDNLIIIDLDWLSTLPGDYKIFLDDQKNIGDITKISNCNLPDVLSGFKKISSFKSYNSTPIYLSIR